jgi:CheY-like chemotaxis protein
VTDAALILVIDDDYDVCEVYAEALAESGYDVVTRRNGQDALLFLDEATTVPDLILVDLMMPVMDGAEFVTRLRQRPELDAVPVIVMTANRGRPPVEDTPQLLKPFTIDVLRDTVRRYTGETS